MHLAYLSYHLCSVWAYEPANFKLHRVSPPLAGFKKKKQPKAQISFWCSAASLVNNEVFSVELFNFCPQMHSSCILAACLKLSWLNLISSLKKLFGFPEEISALPDDDLSHPEIHLT